MPDEPFRHLICIDFGLNGYSDKLIVLWLVNRLRGCDVIFMVTVHSIFHPKQDI